MIQEVAHYIVCSRNRGPSSSPAKHATVEMATNEASRLAEANKSDRFYIYKAVRAVSAPRVNIVDLEDDEPPF